MGSFDDDTQISLSMTIPSSLSLCGSFLVCLSYVVFQDLRRLRYVELVFYMSLNDMIASIGSVMGVTHTVEACTFQGIVTNMNFLASVLWCVVVTYQLWLVITSGKMISNSEMRIFHVFCWGFPVLAALLPLINTTYGHDNGNTWCFISETDDSPSWAVTFWSLASFYLWILLSIIVMTVLMVDLLIKVRSMHTSNSNIILNSLKKLIFYPIVFIICWIPSYISDYKYSQDSSAQESTNISGSILPCLQGFFLSIIFFYQNIVVRKKWVILISSYLVTTPEVRDSLVSSVVLIESEIDYIRPSERSTEVFVNNPTSTRDWLFGSQKSSKGSAGGSITGVNSNNSNVIDNIYRESHRSQFDSGTSGKNSSIEL